MNLEHLVLGFVAERGFMTEAELVDILKEDFGYLEIHRAIDGLCKKDIIYPDKNGYRFDE